MPVKLQKLLRLEPAMKIWEFWQVANAPPCLHTVYGLPQNAHSTLCLSNQASDDFYNSTFTGSIWAEEAKRLTTIGGEAHIFHRDQVMVRFI